MTLETAKELLAKYHQEHVLQYYDTLSDTEKAALLEQIEETDFSVTEQITAGKGEQARGVITPIQAMTLSEISENAENFTETGLEAIRAGKVAAVLLAGGMGTRLGSDIQRECMISVLQNRFIFSSASSVIFSMWLTRQAHGSICLS